LEGKTLTEEMEREEDDGRSMVVVRVEWTVVVVVVLWWVCVCVDDVQVDNVAGPAAAADQDVGKGRWVFREIVL